MRQYTGAINAKGLRICIVQSRFSAGIGEELFSACYVRLRQLGIKSKHITHVTVPGALEIPFALQCVAASGKYDALIALGVVIRGETYHFELVANESANGLSSISLDFSIPIANAILTTEDDEQAIARMHIKGKEAADVAVEMANLQLDLLSEYTYKEKK